MQQYSFRMAFIDNINQIRTNPRVTGEKIYQTLAPLFREEEFRCFGKSIDTFEGVDALNDLKVHLDRYNSSCRLEISDALSSVAERIACEKGVNGRSDHEQPQRIYQQIMSLSQVNGNIGELIALRCNSAEEASTYFLIDDGMASRKRRRMLLDPRYRYIGVGTAKHRQYDTISVVLLAEEVIDLRASQMEPEPEVRGMEIREIGETRDVRDMAQSNGDTYNVRVSEARINNDYRQI